jgi:hypothetical protein
MDGVACCYGRNSGRKRLVVFWVLKATILVVSKISNPQTLFELLVPLIWNPVFESKLGKAISLFSNYYRKVFASSHGKIGGCLIR